uniref:Uncharacterized protein n=1 Tax=viral metagenome TaxID=1070528 RepID=A0A6C0KRB8_9ZZZZ
MAAQRPSERKLFSSPLLHKQVSITAPKDTVTIGIEEKNDDKKEEKSLEVFNPKHTITYNDVVKILKDSYNFDENITSTSLDILALYLKGQKIIYTESKTYCEKRLNTLMLPAILLAAVCSILNFILKDYAYGTIIISGLNACNSFILSIINYLKLAEKSQNHLMAAQRFHNLESRIELKSGRSLFFSKTSIDIEKTLEEIEKEIKEIQSSDQFIVPEAIRYRYPKIYSSNLFALVKEIKNGEMLIINKLKSAVQDIHLYTEEKSQLLEKEKDLIQRIQKYTNEINDFEVEEKLIELKIQHNGNLSGEEESEDESEDEEEVDELVYAEDMDEAFTDSKEIERRKYELQQENARRQKWNQEVRERNQLRQDTRMERVRNKSEMLSKLEMEQKLKLSKINTNMQQLTVRKNQLKTRLEELRNTMKEIDTKIRESDEKKNKAFEATVTHRQRYIDLSDTLNREIDQHIKTSQRYGCNPCDFFNT